MHIRRLLIFAVAVLIFATATLFMSSAKKSGAKKSGAKKESGKASTHAGKRATRAAPKPQAVAARNGVLRIWLHGDDIYPDLARMNPGTVMLVAENQTSSDFTLVVEQVGPGQTPELTSTLSAARHISRVNRTLTLTSGQYVFYEQSRPEVKGKLIVE